MERNICPYLGRPDDIRTPMAFPSEGNFCHKTSPPGSVSREHQGSHCLNAAHSTCPVFQARAAARLPGVLVSPDYLAQQRKQRRDRALLVLALAVYLLAAAFGGVQIAGRVLALQNAPELMSMNPFALLEGPAPIPNTGLLYEDSSPTPEATATEDCPVPQGWVAYTVQPTDSIFRISILRRVSVAELQAANCLGGETFLKPGSVVYVPEAPATSTATATGTSTATLVPSATATYFFPSATALPVQPPPATATPAPVPPTDTPVVAPVQPTEKPVVVPAKPTAKPKPAKEIKEKPNNPDKGKEKDKPKADKNKDKGGGKDKNGDKGKGKGKNK